MKAVNSARNRSVESEFASAIPFFRCTCPVMPQRMHQERLEGGFLSAGIRKTASNRSYSWLAANALTICGTNGKQRKRRPSHCHSARRVDCPRPRCASHSPSESRKGDGAGAERRDVHGGFTCRLLAARRPGVAHYRRSSFGRSLTAALSCGNRHCPECQGHKVHQWDRR